MPAPDRIRSPSHSTLYEVGGQHRILSNSVLNGALVSTFHPVPPSRVRTARRPNAALHETLPFFTRSENSCYKSYSYAVAGQPKRTAKNDANTSPTLFVNQQCPSTLHYPDLRGSYAGSDSDPSLPTEFASSPAIMANTRCPNAHGSVS